MKNKKRKLSNLSISTQILITVISTILVSIILIGVGFSVLRTITPSFYNFSSVSTNSYSLQNQIQWSQTMTNIIDQLIKDSDDNEKINSLSDITKNFKEMDTKIYISKNEKQFFSNAEKEETINLAKSISNSDLDSDLNYSSNHGMVIVSTINHNKNKYKIIVCNDKYTVSNNNQTRDIQEIFNMIFSKTGLIIGLITLQFILIIIISSAVAARSLKKPILILKKGADEIAKGNLDYKMDYDSTNELGVTVKAMNELSSKLKASEIEKNRIDQSRKEMIAGLAHDLRTPLTSVKGYVEGIRDGIANTPEKQEQYIKTIYSSTLDMEKLLDELMDISKLELGKIQLSTEKTNIISFIDEYVEEKLPKLQKYNIDYSYQKPNDTNEINVMLDTNRFSRVLSNIASNSIKYANPDRKLFIELSIQNYEKSVIISLRDNGVGISSDNLTHIFDPFYRADHARTKTREGSGIGLAVCKEIVQLHGGSIWASSTLGEGTTISISLEKIKEDKNEQENINS